ncbi:hypothetical protein CHARACLAT_030755 [Characodon lateralis]|uniref:Uncharacterized protein n=1 Tax=Characodon lateralis TaxID=208331 RepID=A0ABU7EEI4_9TELE|nr:hypothetical protein [Characodon lateralis]
MESWIPKLLQLDSNIKLERAHKLPGPQTSRFSRAMMVRYHSFSDAQSECGQTTQRHPSGRGEGRLLPGLCCCYTEKTMRIRSGTEEAPDCGGGSVCHDLPSFPQDFHLALGRGSST